MQRLLDYVLFHFKRVYHLPEPLEISYGLDGRSRVQVLPAEGSFFESELPRPDQVGKKDWKGTSLPLFFQSTTTQEWFTPQTDGQVQVHYDLVASAFFLLSGWQEYYSPERDQFGRFPYRASVQAEEGFVTIPVVNYYFEILKEAVEIAYGQKIQPRLWQGKPFATCLTHDVDYLQSAWKVAGISALRKGNILRLVRLAYQKLAQNDAWFNLLQVEQELEKLQARATFFFLPKSAKSEGHPNADYDIASAAVQAEISRLVSAGHEIALHGSHGTGTSAAQLLGEREKIPAPVQGNRFHYLRFDPGASPAVLLSSGITYDSSLGFPEHYGFRHSYCHPFRLFSFKERAMQETWELPLNLMDITLHHPRYLQLAPRHVMPAVTPLLNEIIRFHGVFTLLWHNENFTPYALPQGVQIFRDLTRYCSRAGTAFLTASEAVAHASIS